MERNISPLNTMTLVPGSLTVSKNSLEIVSGIDKRELTVNMGMVMDCMFDGGG